MIEKVFVYTMGTGMALLGIAGGVALRLAVDVIR